MFLVHHLQMESCSLFVCCQNLDGQNITRPYNLDSTSESSPKRKSFDNIRCILQEKQRIKPLRYSLKAVSPNPKITSFIPHQVRYLPIQSVNLYFIWAWCVTFAISILSLANTQSLLGFRLSCLLLGLFRPLLLILLGLLALGYLDTLCCCFSALGEVLFLLRGLL